MRLGNLVQVNRILKLALLLSFLIVIYVEYSSAESFSSGLMILIAWNVSPLIIAWIFLHRAYRTGISHRRANLTYFMAAGFVTTACTAIVLTHLAWLFDWDSTATGSSTAGLIFVTLPIVDLIAGGVGFLIGWVSGNIFISRHGY